MIVLSSILVSVTLSQLFLACGTECFVAQTAITQRSKSFEWHCLYASWQYVTMLKTGVVAGGWWVGWGKNTHLTFLPDRTPTVYYAAATRQLKVDAPKLYMNTIAMGSNPEYEGEACIRVSFKGTPGCIWKEEGIRTPEWWRVVKAHGTGA